MEVRRGARDDEFGVVPKYLLMVKLRIYHAHAPHWWICSRAKVIYERFNFTGKFDHVFNRFELL